MNIAIIGTGISGLVAAYLLKRQHNITVYEANDYIGGHTHTVNTTIDERHYAIDTGFIVFNDWTYPKFIQLINQLGVKYQQTTMSFSVKCETSGLEYNGTSFNSLFAQRSNLIKPSFWRMLNEIIQFNRQALTKLANNNISENITLGSYLLDNQYSKTFINNYIIPMGAAIWSASVKDMLDYPLHFFLRFFANHGMLSMNERPQWQVIKGGSNQYVTKLIQNFKDDIYLNTPIATIHRRPTHVAITTTAGQQQDFDAIVIATHSDQALKLLADSSKDEETILKALPYQENEVVLHTDTSLLPKKSLAWASWNYFIPSTEQDRSVITYNMNLLRNIKSSETFCVTLNNTSAINPNKIISQHVYHHPTYTLDGINAQQRYDDISGINRTYYCGAYWANGFHEDGVVSALRVAEKFGEKL